MVYKSQQSLMPGILDSGGGVLLKSRKMWDNSFSKVLNSKMRSLETGDIKSRGKGIGMKRPLSTGPGSNSDSDKQYTEITDDKSVKIEEVKKPIRDLKPMKRAESDKDTTCVGPDTVNENVVLHADDLKRAKELQYALDQILDLLKKLLLFTEANLAEEDCFSDGTAGFPKVSSGSQNAAVPDMLRAELQNMLCAAEQLEGTKTSEIAVKFAGRLIELLDDEKFAEMIEKISVRPDSALKNHQEETVNLLRKMLNEAEKAKMDITSESIDEIIIPAMNSKMTQQAGKGLNQQQAENSEEQQPKATLSAERNHPVEPAAFKPVNNPVSQRNETEEIFAFAKPRQEKTSVSDFISRPDMASFTDAIKSEDMPVKADSIIREPVDAGTFVARQVVEKIETLAGESKKEIVLQLKPDSLGKITLRVIHERGEIVARFVAENDQVKSILENNMQMLKDSLQRNGVSVQNLSVSVGQQNEGRNTGDNPGWNSEPVIKRYMAEKVTVIAAGHETYGLSGLTGSMFDGGEPEIDLTA